MLYVTVTSQYTTRHGKQDCTIHDPDRSAKKADIRGTLRWTGHHTVPGGAPTDPRVHHCPCRQPRVARMASQGGAKKSNSQVRGVPSCQVKTASRLGALLKMGPAPRFG